MAARSQVAPLLASVVGIDGSGSVSLIAHDGSTVGPPDAAIRLIVRDPCALNYVATAPNDLGLARAYVTGYLEVEGDLFSARRSAHR